jgi:hypothetical protein
MVCGLKRPCRLLILGLLFLSTAGCVSFLTNASETDPAAAEPKILHDNIELGPSLSARMTKIQFFESGRSDIELRQKRIYEGRFAQAAARTVYTEIRLEYSQPGKKIDFNTTLVCFRENGTTFRIEEYRGRIDADWTSSTHWIGIGNHSAGGWNAGVYKIDVLINGDKVATGSFEIYQ